MTNPDEPEPDTRSKLSLLAQTIQAIGGSLFTLGVGMPQVEFDEAMWNAALYLSMGEYACCRKLKAEWRGGNRWG